MKTSFALSATLCLVCTTWAEPPASQPARQIPLESIYATSSQKPLQHVADGPMPLYDGAGPTLCAVAWGKEFKSIKPGDLVGPLPEGSGKVVLGLKRPSDPDMQLWAVIYFGASGSQPPQFLIDSVTATGNDFELAHHMAPPGPMTKDLFTYVAWVPLGKLSSGKYTMKITISGKVKDQRSWEVADALTQ